MPYRLESLGRVQLLRDGQPVESLTGHRQKLALLAYLALQPELRAPRDRLVPLFWPDRDESSARHSLSELLYELRKEVGGLLETTRGDVGLVAGAFECDAVEFRGAAEAGDITRAANLYAGPFLEGFSPPSSSEFEHWADRERAQLHRLHRKVCRELVSTLRDRADFEEAIAWVRHWLASDPFEDEANHCLIELLFLSGARSAALEHFDRYTKLCKELDVKPLDETRELVERIRAGEPAGVVREEPRAPAAYAAPTPREPGPAAASPQPSLASALVLDRPPRRVGPLFRELRRRHVLEVVALYLGAALLGARAAGIFEDRLAWPGWVAYLIYAGLVLGLPLAAGFAWASGYGPATVSAAGGPPLLVISRKRMPPGFRWVAALRPTDLMGLLGIAALSLVVLLLMIPPVRPTTAPTLDPKRIAVLYLDDHSAGQDLDYLAAGLTEALIHELGQVQALAVISSNGVKPYKDAELAVAGIARELDVGSLVVGSVARSGDLLRVGVELIDGATGLLVESKTLDRPWGELFALQDDLARGVSGFLRRRLGLEIRLRERKAETRSVAAWELVRRAERVREDYTPLRRSGEREAASRVLERADSLLAEAEGLDRDWVDPIVQRGWVALRQAGLLSPTPGTYQEGWARRGLAHAERALRLKPEDPQALELRGTLRYRLSRQISDSAEAARLLESAERDLRDAVMANPSQASAWSALSELLHVGKAEFAEAKQAALRAYKEDAFLSDAQDILFRLSNISLELKDYEEAIHWAEEGRRRWPDLVDFFALELGFLASEGPEPDVEKAWELVHAIDTLSSPQRRALFLASAEMWAAAVLARAGLADSGRAVIQRARARVSDDQLPWLAYDEARARLLLGERDEALRSLSMHLESDPQRKTYIAQDPWFEDLRNDPRFKALVGTAR